jgi:hypothetical protein
MVYRTGECGGAATSNSSSSAAAAPTTPSLSRTTCFSSTSGEDNSFSAFSTEGLVNNFSFGNPMDFRVGKSGGSSSAAAIAPTTPSPSRSIGFSSTSGYDNSVSTF